MYISRWQAPILTTCSRARTQRTLSLTPPRNVISLTTIPPRMEKLRPTLESLLRQDAPIDSVILWIPESYRRREFGNFQVPTMPDGIEVRRCPVDYGPATKILPAVEALKGQNVRILYCDDDRIYHSGWAANLIRESDLHPGECIAEAGEAVQLAVRRAFKASPAYLARKLVTFGLYGYFFRRKNRLLDPGYGLVDICHGYGGALVRPEFFSPAAFDIPDLLWTVDDIWLSGQLAVNCIPIRKITRRPNSDKTDLANVSALIDYVAEDHGRHRANLACIRYFQQRHRIWPMSGMPHP